MVKWSKTFLTFRQSQDIFRKPLYSERVTGVKWIEEMPQFTGLLDKDMGLAGGLWAITTPLPAPPLQCDREDVGFESQVCEMTLGSILVKLCPPQLLHW
jgi:hypothetical protein